MRIYYHTVMQLWGLAANILVMLSTLPTSPIYLNLVKQNVQYFLFIAPSYLQGALPKRL